MGFIFLVNVVQRCIGWSFRAALELSELLYRIISFVIFFHIHPSILSSAGNIANLPFLWIGLDIPGDEGHCTFCNCDILYTV